MSRDDHASIPDELRARIEDEPADERAGLERVWRLLGEADPASDAPPADQTWAAVQQRLTPTNNEPARSDRPAQPHAPDRSRRPAWQTWGAAAAALLLVAVAGVLFWRQPALVEAPPGERVTATLPDGSTVELNSGTTLRYARNFSTWPLVPAERRVVQLDGEAFFDVRGGTRPFVVETFNAQVQVLGTQFNVRARAEKGSGMTHVTLAEGRVQVRATKRPDDSVVLAEAGQSSRVTTETASPTPPERVEVDHALAWRRLGFAVTEWPLSMIFAEIERRYNTTITVRSHRVLADSMTLYYPRDTDAQTIIHDIAVAKGLSYRPTSQGYEITAE